MEYSIILCQMLFRVCSHLFTA